MIPGNRPTVLAVVASGLTVLLQAATTFWLTPSPAPAATSGRGDPGRRDAKWDRTPGWFVGQLLVDELMRDLMEVEQSAG